MKNKFYVPPEDVEFYHSKYKSYWAFLWLLNCSDEQFNGFLENSDIAFDEFNWAYDFLIQYLCKR